MATFDETRAFEVDGGIILNDGAGVFSGIGNPNDSGGTSAPLGSFYIDKSTGDYYRKLAAPDIGWTLQSGGGLDGSTHRALDQLVHDVAEDSYTEVIYSGNNVTDVIIWTDNGKTIKIKETNLVYTGNKITTETIKQYDAVGTLVEILTNTYAYSGNNIINYTSVLS